MEKIRNLINLKDNEGATAAEAANAAEKLNNLLLKHNLTMMQAEDYKSRKEGKEAKKNQPEDRRVDLDKRQGRHDADWLIKLFNTLAYFNMCMLVRHRTHRHQYDQGMISIIGAQHNIEIVIYFVDQLVPKIEQGYKQTWNKYKDLTHEKRNTFRRGFLTGCVEGISTKLSEMERYRKHQAEQEKFRGIQGENTQMGLMVINNRALIKDFIDQKFGNLRTSQGGELRKSALSRELGRKHGRSMDINKGVGGNNTAGNLN